MQILTCCSSSSEKPLAQATNRTEMTLIHYLSLALVGVSSLSERLEVGTCSYRRHRGYPITFPSSFA
ncbi:unnamed protein product [Lupinus luteus]|uniref:Uncharacterized protein n=1 Tax=Lupinus luteus TaxID=3873 RepID=A0AAV1WIM8_LUPLU